MLGRSRLVNNEQRLAMLRRPHEKRGCCDPLPDPDPVADPPNCCRPFAPPIPFTLKQGDTPNWRCMICGTWYVLEEHEAEGSAWWPIVLPSENADRPSEPHPEVPVTGN